MLNLPQSLEKLELDNKKIFLIALISIFVFYLDYAYVIKSQLKGIKDTSSKVIKLEKDMGNLSKDLVNMQDLENKAGEAPQLSSAKNKIIISEDQVASLLESISAIGNKNNIKIMQIKPVKESKTKDSAANSVLISLDLVGGYHNIGSFISQIENARELMGVEGIKVESDSVNYLQQRINLMLRAYVKK